MISSEFISEIRRGVDNRQIRIAALIVFIFLGAFGAWYGYRLYKDTQRQEAQLAFSSAMDDFYKAQAGRVAWEDVTVVADVAYHRHSQAWTAPYLLGVEAYALEQNGKIDEAIKIWEKIVQLIDHSNPFWYIFSTKKAVVKTQSSSDEIKKEGVEELQALGRDEKNIYRDQALYYWGLFEKKAWVMLAEQFGQTDSPWVALIHTR